MDEQLSILGEITTVKTVKTAAPKKPKNSSKRETSSSIMEVYAKLVNGLGKFFKEQNFKKGVIGLSGGVDSSLTLKIAVDALGAQNVFAIIMPELGLSKQENIDHAKILAGYFSVMTFYQPINSFLADYRVVPWKSNQLADMNVKARVRMSLLYHFANTENALVLGTSNRSEILLGYGTKFGDLACDIEVIGNLYKTEVTRLANELGLPPEIVNKMPTAELSEGQTDENELGATYAEMDNILMKLDLGIQGCIEHGLAAPLVHKVFQRVENNKHKSKPAFMIQI